MTVELEEIVSVSAAMLASEDMATLRTHGLSLDFAVVDVTPTLAQRWLKLDRGDRPEKAGLITKYSSDMTHGWWKLTGQAIEFSDNGSLLNGHHRLRSIVKSGVTVAILIISGFPEDTRDCIDIGKSRSAADHLAREGYHNTAVLAAGTRLVIAWSTGRLGKKASSVISQAEIRRFVKENSYLVTATDFATMIRGRWDDIAPSAIVGAMWAIVSAGHTEERARLFFVSMADMSTEGLGDPRYVLRERLSKARMRRQRIENGHMLAMIVESFNAYHTNKSLRELKIWTGNRPSVPAVISPSLVVARETM